MEEPPSVLDVEVFHFDGPFDQDVSLGHAEINFLKHTSTELADMWLLLEGKLAQSSQSKLHLRIFLDNNKGVQTIKEYLGKMEKEVGKKVRISIRNLSYSILLAKGMCLGNWYHAVQPNILYFFLCHITFRPICCI